MDRLYEGCCHCGSLRWQYRTSVVPEQWQVRACQCRFCRAHGARCTSDPNGSAMFDCDDVSALQRYSFGLNSAEFVVCSRCGVYIGAIMRDGDEAFTTLNLNSMSTKADPLEAEPMYYEAENHTDRVQRRKIKWTPVSRDFARTAGG